jgi:hypothetical protein
MGDVGRLAGSHDDTLCIYVLNQREHPVSIGVVATGCGSCPNGLPMWLHTYLAAFSFYSPCKRVSCVIFIMSCVIFIKGLQLNARQNRA